MKVQSFFGLFEFRTVKPVVLALCLASLAGCGDVAGFDLANPFSAGSEGQAGSEASGPTATFTEKDVEAPEVFSAKESGLWDGRPSLGGVWVAHPDVSEPERVMVKNQSNGKSVVGALFRREREIPGPRLQISSDAARALGVVAGAPVELDVVALRKARIPVTQLAQDGEAARKESGEAAPAPFVVAGTTLEIADAGDVPVARSSPPVSRLEKPYIQVGIFNREENAERTAKQMRSAGMIPTIRAQETKAKPFWRVIVGPAGSSSERRKLQDRIRAEGFSDAYAVTN